MKRTPRVLTVLAVTLFLNLHLAPAATAAVNESPSTTEAVLYSFLGNEDGLFPDAGLVMDASGNLYGTTAYGGGQGTCILTTNVYCGTAFELSPSAGGGYTETVLHSFGAGTDGQNPEANLVLRDGNLYGTTAYGGTHGFGTVFVLTRVASVWKEKVIHNFAGGADDGQTPAAGLVFDKKGNLYGTTNMGGPYPCGNYTCGTVFELSPATGGGWKESILYTFTGGADGANPLSNLIFDSLGNLYGTTDGGGTSFFGTVFELSPVSGGWKESVLHSFTGGTDGQAPQAGVVFDTKGSLYGTTVIGGPNDTGVVFRLSPASGGSWTETILHGLSGNSRDPSFQSGVIFGGENLYGTTGGTVSSGGTVYELTPTKSGPWTITVLYTFGGAPDGSGPHGGLIRDSSGHFYGTTYNGGSLVEPLGGGVVFEVTP
jgi:uncharacterized repeat protein (TIGR03803 family)